MKQIQPLITAAILAIALVASTSAAPTQDKRSLLHLDKTIGNLLHTDIDVLGKVKWQWTV
jgi:hypothetical protein